MSNIPGLDLCPVDDANGDGIQVQAFNDSVTVIPESHRHGHCRPIHDFEKIAKIAEGSFGTMYKCRDKRTNGIILLKKLKMPSEHNDGIPSHILREVNILNSLKHLNILNQRGTVAGRNLESNYLIFDYCSNSLDDLIEKNANIFDKPVIKCIMKQLFEGLDFIHGGTVIHRNITCQNILFHEAGILKITGFQSSRFYSKGNMTPGVTQLEYRAPELLLEAKQYGSSVDMWSAGCVFAKLLLKQSLFSGTSQLAVLASIYDVLGSPSETIWPGFNELLTQFDNISNYELENEKPFADLKRCFVGQSATCKDMIQDLLLYYPNARLTAQECLKCFYFSEGPKECSTEDLSAILQKIQAPTDDYMIMDI